MSDVPTGVMAGTNLAIMSGALVMQATGMFIFAATSHRGARVLKRSSPGKRYKLAARFIATACLFVSIWLRESPGPFPALAFIAWVMWFGPMIVVTSLILSAYETR